MSSPATKSRLARNVPALPSSTGSSTECTSAGRCAPPCGHAPPRHRWCRLTRTSSTPARPARPARCRAAAGPPISTMHFGVRVGDRAQPRAEPGGQQECLHRDRAVCRTTPERAHLARPPRRAPRRDPASPRATPRTRPRSPPGVRRGAQPSCCSASMSEKMCRVSPNRYSPLIRPGSVGAVVAAHDLRELLRWCMPVPPPTLKTRPAARSSVSTSTLASTTSWMLT